MTERRAPEGSAHIPVIQEEACLGKRVVDAERVQVRTTVESDRVTVRDIVSRARIEIRRVPMDREVAEAPPIREEGDTTIVPVIEERLVVEKRLFLVEEVHLARIRSAEEVALPVDVRRTVVTIERSTLGETRQESF